MNISDFDPTIRTHDRIPFTNDLHGDLLLKMIELKERVQALEKLKGQRLSEFNASETRLNRLKTNVEQLELQNAELSKENAKFMNSQKQAAEVQIAEQIKFQSTLKVEKLKQEKDENQYNEKLEELKSSREYVLGQKADEISQLQAEKINYLQQESILKENIIKSEFECTEVAKELEKQITANSLLQSEIQTLILTSLAEFDNLSLEEAVEEITQEKNQKLALLESFEGLDQQFMKTIEQTVQKSTSVDNFDEEEKTSIQEFNNNGREVGNISCQIEEYNTKGQIESTFKQAVQNESVVEVRQEPQITVKYLDENDKLNKKWTTEIAENIREQEIEQEFQEFEQELKQQKLEQTLLKSNVQTPKVNQEYETPEQLTNITSSQLMPDVFSPQQKASLEKSIKEEIAKVETAEKAKKGITKQQKDQRKKLEYNLDKKQLELKLQDLKNEQNGLRKRLESIEFDKGGDEDLRKVEIEEIRQALQGNALEMNCVRERLTKTLLLLQMYK